MQAQKQELLHLLRDLAEEELDLMGHDALGGEDQVS
jgi:hypothetical protein